MIPVIGTLIVNGVHWLERLIESVDYPVDEFFIINNNGRDQITAELDALASKKHKFINKIKVTHLPCNFGCSGGWNLIIKCYMMKPYWMIVNHDIAFTPGLLKAMHEKATTGTGGLVFASINNGNTKFSNHGSWDLFLIKDWVVQSHGLFDENLYPAYSEDMDYIMRLRSSPLKIDSVEMPYLHGEEDYEKSGSQTMRTEPSLKPLIEKTTILNEGEYLSKKWGSNWFLADSKTHKFPFNDQANPIDYFSYDLSFVRKKYMGF